MTTPSGIHFVSLNNGKANALDGALFDALEQELDRALAGSARAVVLTGYDRYFSAGLNLKSLPDHREGLSAFLDRFERGLLRLVTFPLPVVAAINGHAIAGGLVLATACDVRVTADGDYKIGLSEIDLGVPFPAVALELVRQAVSERWLAELMLGARLLTPAEALDAGLVHHLVPADKLLSEALTHADRLGEKPQPAFRITKAAMRKELVASIEASSREAREAFLDCWFSDEARKRREAKLTR